MCANKETDAGSGFPETSARFRARAHIGFGTLVKSTQTRPLDRPPLAQLMSSTSFYAPPALLDPAPVFTLHVDVQPAVFILRRSVSDMLISPNM